MKAVTDTKYYDEIAEKLKMYGAYSLTLTPADMADAVEEVASFQHSDGYESGFTEGYRDGEDVGWSDGYNDGYDEGHSDGYESGYSMGYVDGTIAGEDVGRQAQCEEFWSKQLSLLRGGANTAYLFAGCGWNSATFYPYTATGTADAPEVMQPVYPVGMFSYFSRGVYPIIDLAARLEECNFALDTSNCSNLQNMFSYARIGRIPKISALGTTALRATFNNCDSLEIIDELELKSDGSNTFSDTFNKCDALREIKITGIIGQNGFDISASSELDSSSIESIISALSEGTTGLTVKLPTEAKATYYAAHSDEYADEETAWAALIGTRQNWTISLE